MNHSTATETIRCYRPGYHLSDCIDYYWISESRSKDFFSRDIIMPDCHAEIIFCLRTPYRVYDVKSGAWLGNSCPAQVIGPRKIPMIFEKNNLSTVIGVHFKPTGLLSLLKFPPLEIVNTAIELDQLIGKRAFELTEKLSEANNDRTIINSLDVYFSNLSCHRSHYYRLLDHIEERMHPLHDNVQVGKLSMDLGMSKKKIQRIFNHTIGLSPKFLSRLNRFKRALNKMERVAGSHSSKLNQWILDFGYYDQAHFIREFKDFTGMTPNEFISTSPRYIV